MKGLFGFLLSLVIIGVFFVGTAAIVGVWLGLVWVFLKAFVG